MHTRKGQKRRKVKVKWGCVWLSRRGNFLFGRNHKLFTKSMFHFRTFPASLTSTLPFTFWSCSWIRAVSHPWPLQWNSRHCEISVTQGSSGEPVRHGKKTVHDLRSAAPRTSRRLPCQFSAVPPRHLVPSYTSALLWSMHHKPSV